MKDLPVSCPEVGLTYWFKKRTEMLSSHSAGLRITTGIPVKRIAAVRNAANRLARNRCLPMNRYFRLVSMVAVIAFAGVPPVVAQSTSRTLTAAPRTKAIALTGSEALSILGVTAAKTELTIVRPYRQVRAGIVAGQLVNGDYVERALGGSIEMPSMVMGQKIIAGFAILPEKKTITLIFGTGTMQMPLPDDYAYDLTLSSPAGIYQDGLLIFAYEPKVEGKAVNGRADTKRYLGLRITFDD